MRPRSKSVARRSLYWLVLLMAVALGFSTMMVFWSTLPVQAQSESDANARSRSRRRLETLKRAAEQAAPQKEEEA